MRASSRAQKSALSEAEERERALVLDLNAARARTADAEASLMISRSETAAVEEELAGAKAQLAANARVAEKEALKKVQEALKGTREQAVFQAVHTCELEPHAHSIRASSAALPCFEPGSLHALRVMCGANG